ncbi:MAG: hypothetical protein HFE81_04355 [Bacilli bacterium]|nr:hypothetical protein [Bacilli bacterium]
MFSKRCAIGKVYGEVWYTATVSLPKKMPTKKLTSDKTYGLSIKTLKKEYNFLNKFSTYQKKEYNIIESEILPINISIAKYIKTKETTKNLTIKTAEEKALEIATKEITKKLTKDEEILSKKVLKKTEINSKIKVEVFFKVKENITAYQDITDLNIEEMNKKEE